MIIFFFMPWAQLLGISVSGYDLQKLGSYGNLVWLIPVCSGITIAVGFYGKRQRELAQLTGALPILGLVYALVKVGPDLFHVLGIGAYLTLITALALLAVVPRMMIQESLVSSTVLVGGGRSPLGSMKVLKLIAGVLLIGAAVVRLALMAHAYLAASSTSPAGFFQIVGGIVGTCILGALGSWLIKSDRKQQ